MPVMGEQAQVCKVHVGSILDPHKIQKRFLYFS